MVRVAPDWASRHCVSLRGCNDVERTSLKQLLGRRRSRCEPESLPDAEP